MAFSHEPVLFQETIDSLAIRPDGVYIDGSITMARKYDNLWLEASGMPMGCQIKNACETIGKNRVMFGIDSPFHHPTVEIQRVLSCGLSDAGLEDVFYNNAASFMGWR